MIRGDFREDIGIFAGRCVPEIQFNKRHDNLNMSLWAHTNTLTRNVTLLPLICHLCAFQQKAFLQDRTGHWELWDLQGLCVHHLQVCGCGCVLLGIPAYLSHVLHVSTESTVRVSVHSCVHHAVILNHVSFGSSVLWLGLLRVWQHSLIQHFEYVSYCTNSAPDLITEHSYKRFIKTYHTHPLMLSLSDLMRWTKTQT